MSIMSSGFAEASGLYERVIGVPSLYQAWRKVRANRGAAGIDAVSLHVFAEKLEVNLRELSRSLLSGAYQPLPARFVRVAKANGKERELAILAVRDRVAQRAVLDAVEPAIESRLNDCCFAFRPARSIEAAVQRLVAARANGFLWTFESDVQDFFGSIDRGLLLKELRPVIKDEQLMALIKLWLDAGALCERKEVKSEGGWRMKGRETLAGARLLVRETFTETLDGYLAERLSASEIDVSDVSLDYDEMGAGDDGEFDEAAGRGANELEEQASARWKLRRTAVKRLVREGALVALTHRALIGKIVGVKLLGAGGLAAAALLATPALRELYRNQFNPARGTLQGAPVSPLLTNFYMTPFDDALTGEGWRLIRYCDDFVIQCRTEQEARAAAAAAAKALKGRRLGLHPEKTRTVPPGGAFEFLGYRFAEDGSVVAPPSTPERIARQISEMSKRGFKRTKRQAEAMQSRTTEGAGGWWSKLKRSGRSES